MKNFLTATTLLVSLAIAAQDGPAYTGGLPYTIKTQTETITFNLPLGTTISDNNRVIINGKTFVIERTDRQPYFDKLNDEQKKSDSPRAKESAMLMHYATHTSIDVKGFNNPGEENPELMKDVRYNYRVMPNGNIMVTWYDIPKEGYGTITTNLNVCMVAGNSIINLFLEGPIDNATDDFKNTELLMRKILDNIEKTQ